MALAAVVFALGIGAGALLLKSPMQNGEELSRGPVAVQSGTLTGRGTPALRIDADHAGFAARAASIGRKPR